MRFLVGLACVLFAIAAPSRAQSTIPNTDAIAGARNVAYCDLAANPAAYNHQLVRLTAFVTHGFEDFQLWQPGCPQSPSRFSLWVEYGGTQESDTVYCCPGGPGGGTRLKPLSIEGVEIPLVGDMVFQQFGDLLKKERDTTVHVTFVGRFFSGNKQGDGSPPFWVGFGHLGCCSLFVIERIEQFDQHTRSDLDYTAEAGWYGSEGCNWRSMRNLRYLSLSEDPGQAIAEQKLADDGPRAWAFDEPRRVATDSLHPFFKDQTPVLRLVGKSSTRQVFRWRRGRRSTVVVVTRPYWLSFYAKSNSVAWISTAIKDAECQ
jgi:hypothetical protein